MNDELLFFFHFQKNYLILRSECSDSYHFNAKIAAKVTKNRPLYLMLFSISFIVAQSSTPSRFYSSLYRERVSYE